MYNFDLRPLIWAGLIVGMFIIGLTWGGFAFFTDDSIKSNTIIIPEIQLIINDNKVDTLYIYHQN